MVHVGSKCRDFKNREVSNVNAPTLEFLKMSVLDKLIPLIPVYVHVGQIMFSWLEFQEM